MVMTDTAGKNRLQKRYDKVARARAEYVRNAARATNWDEYQQVPQKTYMGLNGG